MSGKRMLKAVSTGVDPMDAAKEFYWNASGDELYWTFGFIESLIYHMADLEESQGGYRSTTELHLGAYAKALKGYMMTIDEDINAIP